MVSGLPRPAIAGSARRAPCSANLRSKGSGLISLFSGMKPETIVPWVIATGNVLAATTSAPACRSAAGMASRKASASARSCSFERDAASEFKTGILERGPLGPRVMFLRRRLSVSGADGRLIERREAGGKRLAQFLAQFRQFRVLMADPLFLPGNQLTLARDFRLLRLPLLQQQRNELLVLHRVRARFFSSRTTSSGITLSTCSAIRP